MSIDRSRCMGIVCALASLLAWVALGGHARADDAVQPKWPQDATYEVLAVLADQLCDGPVLGAGKCPNATAEERTRVAALCRADSDIAELRDAFTTSCATVIIAKVASSPSRLLTERAPSGLAAVSAVSWVPTLTDFFVARLEAELALFVQRRIGRALCGESDHTFGKQVVPQTCALLVDASALGLTGLPAALRADLRELLPHLLDAMASRPEFESAWRKHRAVLCVFEAAALAYPTLRDLGPRQALQQLAEAVDPARCDREPALQGLKTAAKLVGAAIDELGAVGATARLSQREVASAVKARFAAQLVEVERADSTRLTKAISVAAEALTRFLQRYAAIAASPQRSPKQLAELLDALAEALATLAARPPGEPGRASGAPDSVLAQVSHVLRAAAALASERYREALTHLLAVSALDEAFAGSKLAAVWNALRRFGPLVTGLAEASSNEEARAVLDAAAAPLGSYRAFRQERWAAFVSGYAGLAIGGELASELPNASMLSPLLPVGVEVGWRRGKESSYNVLLSVIDLGAVAAVRLSDRGSDAMSSAGELRASAQKDLAGVLAPGVFFALGVGDSPFLLGGGAQYLPASRAVFDCPPDVLCGDTNTRGVWRVMGFLGVDLPVLSLSQ